MSAAKITKAAVSRLKNFAELVKAAAPDTIAVGSLFIRPRETRWAAYLDYYFQADCIRGRLAELMQSYSGAQLAAAVLNMEVTLPKAPAAVLRRFRRELAQAERLAAAKQEYRQLLESYYSRLYDDYFIGQAGCEEALVGGRGSFASLPVSWQLRRLRWLCDADGQCNMAEVLPEYLQLYRQSCHAASGCIPLPPLKQQRVIVRQLKKLQAKRGKVLGIVSEQQELLAKYRQTLLNELAQGKF